MAQDFKFLIAGLTDFVVDNKYFDSIDGDPDTLPTLSKFFYLKKCNINYGTNRTLYVDFVTGNPLETTIFEPALRYASGLSAANSIETDFFATFELTFAQNDAEDFKLLPLVLISDTNQDQFIITRENPSGFIGDTNDWTPIAPVTMFGLTIPAYINTGAFSPPPPPLPDLVFTFSDSAPDSYYTAKDFN